MRPSRLLALLPSIVIACAASSDPTDGPPAGASPDAGSPPPAARDAGAPAPSATDAGTTPPPAATDGGTPADAAPPGPLTTTIRVHYPAAGHTVSLRGSGAPYDWNAGAPMTAGPDDTWTISTTAIQAPMEWKPLLDDATWSRGPNYKLAPGATVDVYPHFTQVAGTYSRAYDFPSQILGNTRGVWIYLPPTYLENARAKMPVLYMHDGQNLFDAGAAFGGNEWKVDETMNAAAEDGSIAEAIVIGVENTSDRMSEYTPVADPTDGGGNGAAYVRMLIEELKPKIDHDLRTLPDRDHTAMMGSSLGGLITSYAGVTRADVYGLVGAMSPSTWWDNTWLLGEVATTPASPRPLRVYVDSGDSGPSNDDVDDTKKLAAQYRTIGYADGSTLDYVVQAGGQHNEIYWAERLPAALAFLLGPGR